MSLVKRKGISPLIATVLLIAFTISVGAIIGAWVTGFSKGKSDDLDKSAGSTIDCAGAGIKFEKTDIGTTKIGVTNTGDMTLDNLRIIVQNGTGEDIKIFQYQGFGINESNPLRPGDKMILSNDSMNIETGNKVTVISSKCSNAKYTIEK